MTRISVAALALTAIASLEPLAAQSGQRQSTLEIQETSGQCPQDHWCLSLQIIGARSGEPIPGALLLARSCSPLLANDTGHLQTTCTQTGQFSFGVAQIGYVPARAEMSPELGRSYTGMATLAGVGDGVLHVFPVPVPCDDLDDEAAEVRCLEHVLDRAMRDMQQTLDSTRQVVPDVAMVDSAQSAWSRYMIADCQVRASAALESPAVANLHCRLDHVTQRTYRLTMLRLSLPEREPSN